ncbi:MAG: helix-hairpin-helix domain-containing protein [Candidatus Cloacimonetes bacterium]|nr:helix-hairpin-helix domain-containing protein [Candidatus Cloacimonadota bacterium]
MKNPFNNWFTPDEQRILIFLIFFGFVGFLVQYTGLIAEENPEATDSLKVALQEDFEIKYDLTIVTKKQLMSIPGIGEKRASDIIAFRTETGFNNKRDLLNIRGIGEKSYLKIENYFIDFGEISEIGNSKAKKDTIKVSNNQKVKSKPKKKTEQIITEKIDINSADENLLIKLKGIGPSKAKKIIELRTELGGFSTIEQIMQVKGIGQKTFEKFKDHIFVGERK